MFILVKWINQAFHNPDFEDTDTALIDFSTQAVSETKEISENIYIDIDSKGNFVSMTIEHAKKTGALNKLIYEKIKSA